LDLNERENLMPYVVNVESVSARESKISQADATDHSERVTFRTQRMELNVKVVPSSCLLYRTANMRTIVRQREEISRRGLEQSFFDLGEENNETQQVQHQILLKMAQDPTADIYSVVRDTQQQRDPLLITVKGVVVNGNRRLAAMRELHATNPEIYSAFTHVEVAILPSDANDRDLSEIETRLQITPDLRSAYGWVEEALGLRGQLKRGWTKDEAASVWGVAKAELDKRLAHLALAEQYLSFFGRSGDYKVVAEDKQVIDRFTNSQKIRSEDGTVPATLLEAERLVMFAVLANDVAERKYLYANDIEAITREVSRQIDDVPIPAVADVFPDPMDPLSGLAPQAGGIRDEILDFLRDPNLSTEIAQKAELALADIKARKLAERHGRQLLEAVKQSLSKISGITLTNTDENTYDKALVQLISLQCEAARIMGLLLSDKPSLARDINLAVRNPLKEVISTIKKLNELAD